MASLPFNAKKPSAPFVYITGAGPGDPALLTLKTYHLLTYIADVVVYDRLIPDEIIDIIPEHTPRIYAGKSCRKHHMTQDEINACLVEQAKQSRVVVRLKGGDPFIFGRGGEEAQHLIKHHIPFEVVPGVNAADGACAYYGIPLTHRGVASGVRFITGHQQKGEEVPLDWQGLANPDTTLVIFMGMTRLETICDNLIKHGLASDTPVAAITKGTTPQQQICRSTLGHLYTDLKNAHFEAPTLIVVGKVVGLASDSYV